MGLREFRLPSNLSRWDFRDLAEVAAWAASGEDTTCSPSRLIVLQAGGVECKGSGSRGRVIKEWIVDGG